MTEAPARVREHPRSSLDLPAVRLPGIGPESAKLLERLGVRTIGDLLWHLPTRYKDFSRFRQPALEPADAPLVHTGRLVPVYGLTEGLKDGQVRRWLHTAIEGGPRRTAIVGEVPEPLPQDLRNRHRLPDIAAALRQVHFPD